MDTCVIGRKCKRYNPSLYCCAVCKIEHDEREAEEDERPGDDVQYDTIEEQQS
jgi:hypothetical protein